MATPLKKIGIIATALVALIGTAVVAHPMTFKGTVAAVESKRIQIKTGEEKKGESPEWFEINAKTKIVRGKTTLTFDKAKIAVGERAVVSVDHGADGVMRAVEIRLAAQ